MHTRIARWLWLLTGHLALAIGVVGIFLPLLPTTPFLLVASFCYSKGSERFEFWLIHHKTLGPFVRDWREHRVIPVRAKVIATCAIAASVTFVWFKPAIPLAGKIAMTLVVSLALLFILTRASSVRK